MSLFLSNETINVPVSQLRTLVDEIRGYSNDAATAFDEILNISNCLQSDAVWIGKAAEAADIEMHKNLEQFSPIADKLEEMADFLVSVADEMEAVDARIKSQAMSI